MSETEVAESGRSGPRPDVAPRRRRRSQPRGDAASPAAADPRCSSGSRRSSSGPGSSAGDPFNCLPAAARRPAAAHARAVLPRPDPAALVGTTVGAGRSPHVVVPARADRRPARRRHRHRRGQGRRRPLAATSSSRTRRSREEMGGTPAPRPAVRGRPRHRQDLHSPRRWPPRPACRSCSCRPRRSSRCTTARPRARSARTSRRCARPPARRAARSASSRRSTRSRMARGGVSADDHAGCRSAPPVRCMLRRPRRPAVEYAIAGRVASSHGRRLHGGGSERADGVVNELLVQMQSFDEPTGMRRSCTAWLIDRVNLFLPAAPPAARARRRRRPTSCSSPRPTAPTTSTRRCCGPGRFDRRLTFELPAKAGRRELDRPLPGAARRTTPELDDDERRDALAAVTQGYTPGDDRAPASTRRWSTRCAAGDRAMTLGRRRAAPGWSRRSASASRSPTPTTRSG